MELFGQGAVLTFDGPVVSIVGDVQHLVVVFGLGPFQLHLSLLEQLSDSGRGGVMLICVVEGLDACFILLGIELTLGEREECGQRVRFKG